MATGNKGEWSEFYAFIKLLADREIYAADENLLKIENLFYPVLRIIRNEAKADREYEFIDKKSVRVSSKGIEIGVVNASDLKEKTLKILEVIRTSDSRTFPVLIADELMTRFGVTQLKAGNSRKEDITLKLQDRINRTDPEIGFSIKSMIGGAATLLNASAATNFIYEIVGLDPMKIDQINAIKTRSKVRDRLAKTIDLGGRFKYFGMQSEIFSKNLRKIELLLPEIVAELLLAYYYGMGSTMAELAAHLGTKDVKILDFDLDESDYKLKIKTLLHNVALGMVPNSIWDGTLRAHGGYIVVRDDGEIVSYNAYNIDEFRSYLFRNTKFETPSTGRHDYGYLYIKEEKIFMKLNLQIRFLH